MTSHDRVKYATTPRMRECAARALSVVKRELVDSPLIDDALMLGVADGLDISKEDAVAMHGFFAMTGMLDSGCAPRLNVKDNESIVASLYGGTNGIHWVARVVREIKENEQR